MPGQNSKFMKRNVLGGLVIICAGGALLAACAYDFISSSAYANDIHQEFCDFNGCRPMEQISREAGVNTGIFGAIVTSVGFFFFVYGIRQHTPKPPA